MATIGQLLDEMVAFDPSRIDVLVLPPSVYLSAVVARLADSPVGVGAQNIHAEPAGAFTGEIAAEMVVDVGATFVLVGHSERRQLFGETNEVCAAKCGAALRAGLSPVICVGETGAERERGAAVSVVMDQLEAIVDQVGIDALQAAVIAYEPVWAIGTGRTATPEDAQSMHAAIRSWLGQRSRSVAIGMRILYGGSIKPDNAAALFAQPDIDGGLVGGASLNSKQFLQICRAA